MTMLDVDVTIFVDSEGKISEWDQKKMKKVDEALIGAAPVLDALRNCQVRVKILMEVDK